MTHDATHSYTYDAENRLSSVDGGATTYIYSADGQRVNKTTATGYVDYFYDLEGNVVGEWTNIGGSTLWNAEYVYANGQLVAEYEGGNNTTSFVHKDHLGSTRVMTNVSGSVTNSMDYLPYGELSSSAVLVSVVDEGFENSTSGWVAGFWGCNSTTTTSQSHSGTSSLAQTGSTTGGSYQDVGGLTAGTSYQVSVWVKADPGTTSQAMLWVHDTNGGNNVQTSLITPGTGWQQLSLTFSADSTNAMRIHLYYAAGSGTIYYDDVVVQQLGGSSSGTTHMFTGKERDAESGLDNFGARYMGSNLGRFMSPDPLLNSGHPANPQTWNRYTYTLNNPLNFLDPTGLYTLQNTCDAGDKKCNKNFEKNAKDLKNGLAALQKKVDGMKDSAQKARLEASLKSLGTDKDTSNGVNVHFGATGTGAAGNTVPVYDSAADKVTGYNITLDPSKMGHSDATGEQDMAIDAAHEGTHVSDLAREYANPNAQPELSLFSLEYRGYQTSAWAAGALGLPNLSVNGNVIWNGSWATADKQITSVVVGLDKPGTPNPPHAETQPHNPWQN